MARILKESIQLHAEHCARMARAAGMDGVGSFGSSMEIEHKEVPLLVCVSNDCILLANWTYLSRTLMLLCLTVRELRFTSPPSKLRARQRKPGSPLAFAVKPSLLADQAARWKRPNDETVRLLPGQPMH